MTERLHGADGSPHRLISEGQLEVNLMAAGIEIETVQYGSQKLVERSTAHLGRGRRPRCTAALRSITVLALVTALVATSQAARCSYRRGT